MVSFLIILLTVFQLLAAFLLIGIILIQQSKAGGGLGAVGGGTTETVFGATAGNVLTKGTVILASIFLGAALLVQVLDAKANPNRSATENFTDDAKEDPKVDEAKVDEAKTDVDAKTDDAKPAAAEKTTPAPKTAE